jgi:F-box and leucine-rich repeat protein 2/20
MEDLLLNEDVSMSLLSELIDFRSMGTLDMAITNRRTRMMWLQLLRSISGGDVDNWLHNHSSMRWLITRGVRTSSLRMNSKHCASITDLTIIDLDIATVRHVSLRDCQRITGVFVSTIAARCPLIESIDLCGCGGVDGESISALAHGCPLLQSIDLSFCRRLTDAGILAIAQGCPLLQSIDLCLCDRITDTGIAVLVSDCPLLRNLHLYVCQNVTCASVLAIRQSNPLLKIFH